VLRRVSSCGKHGALAIVLWNPQKMSHFRLAGNVTVDSLLQLTIRICLPIVLTGATGMVAGYALCYSLNNAAVNSVTSIGRKKLASATQNSKRSCIKTSQTVPRFQMCSRVKMGRSFASEPTRARCRTRNSTE